jgi:hypothetical protein
LLVTGGGGAALCGPLRALTGGLGAGRLGTSPLTSFGRIERPCRAAGGPRGIGGGDLGFSKLVSVCTGNRGLAGGLINGVIEE